MDKKPTFINNIVTPVGILAYPHLANPDQGRQYSDGKFKVTLILPKSKDMDEAMGPLKAKVMECAKAAFGAKITKFSDFAHPFKDGTSKAEKSAAFQDALYLVAKSKRKPTVLDRTKAAFPADQVYGGCHGRLVLTAMSYIAQGKPGVTFLLETVQFVKDGERMVGGGGDGSSALPDDLPPEDADDPANYSAPTAAAGSDLFG